MKRTIKYTLVLLLILVLTGPVPAQTNAAAHNTSDPDGLDNGGADKPGGTGGFDNDKDNNNGCGNDTDFEDDNRGNCGGRRKKRITTTTVPITTTVVETTTTIPTTTTTPILNETPQRIQPTTDNPTPTVSTPVPVGAALEARAKELLARRESGAVLTPEEEDVITEYETQLAFTGLSDWLAPVGIMFIAVGYIMVRASRRECHENYCDIR